MERFNAEQKCNNIWDPLRTVTYTQTHTSLFSVGARVQTMASIVTGGELCWQHRLRWMEILCKGTSILLCHLTRLGWKYFKTHGYNVQDLLIRLGLEEVCFLINIIASNTSFKSGTGWVTALCESPAGLISAFSLGKLISLLFGAENGRKVAAKDTDTLVSKQTRSLYLIPGNVWQPATQRGSMSGSDIVHSLCSSTVYFIFIISNALVHLSWLTLYLLF